MKICARCNQEIHNLEGYYTIIEVFAEKTIAKRHIHKKCWEETPRAMAMKMVAKAANIMNKAEERMGLDDEKVVKV